MSITSCSSSLFFNTPYSSLTQDSDPPGDVVGEQEVEREQDKEKETETPKDAVDLTRSPSERTIVRTRYASPLPSYLSLPLFLSSFSSYPSLLILIYRSSLIRNDSRRVLPEGKGGSPSMSVAKKALDDAEQSERAVELIFEELMVFHLLSITSFLCLTSLLHPPFLYLSPAHHSSCLF